MGNGNDKIRLSQQALPVLEALLESPAESLSGADLHRLCGIAAGTLYPVLLRLEAAGWLASRWETSDPSSTGGARRRLYRLTSMGLREASAVFASFNKGVLA